MDAEDLEDLIPEEITGACGLIAPFVVYVFIAISILINRSWFNWADHALSHLGEVGTSYNNVFNAGLIIGGILGLIFIFGLIQYAEELIGYYGIAFFGAGMVFLILVGIFPMGRAGHEWISALFFITSLSGLTAFGMDQVWDLMEPSWGFFILSSVILCIVSAGLVTTIPYETGAAIPEFIVSIPIMQFTFVFGARIFIE
ncbi:MAG: DUF998 domain-containing protein [Candidatus Saliniplasma sp.]